MEPMEQENEDPALIPGLPDDIAFSCLARVSRKSLPILSCVSRRWTGLVRGEEFHAYRAEHHLTEAWIYALCRDMSEQLCLYVLNPNQLREGWRQIHGIPDRCLKRHGVGFEVLGKNVYLFGGCHWGDAYATDEVYCYNASMNIWSPATPLSTPGFYYASEALNGKIYSLGWYSWSVYDADTSSWTSYEDLKFVPGTKTSMVLDGKIHVQSHNEHNVVVYEPSSATWQCDDTKLFHILRGPAVAIDGVLYVLQGVQLLMWQKSSSGEWELLNKTLWMHVKSPRQLVATGKKIFVIGNRLATLMFDVENVGRMYSVQKLASHVEVISCKSLVI